MLVGRFNYYIRTPPDAFPMGGTGEPNGVSALELITPAAGVTRGQKTIVRNRSEALLAKINVNAMSPPTLPRVRWQQTRAQADPRLGEVSFSRLDLLRQGRGEAAT